MKKIISGTLVVLLCFLATISAFAASDEPVIILEPQNPNYPEYSTAIYTVKATGKDLQATWYMQWQGETYNLSDNTNSTEPWEGYAGESYGGIQEDANTFSYFFGGIEYGLDGASIWCVIESGNYKVTSQKARISVGNEHMPPVIVDIPSQLVVELDDYAEIRCVAQAPGNTQLSYIWYETSTGKIEDIQAINRGTEDSDYLICDTSVIGTRYYVCSISTTDGGLAYSSIVPVSVTEKMVLSEPPVETETGDSAPTEETTESTSEAPDNESSPAVSEAPSNESSPTTSEEPSNESTPSTLEAHATDADATESASIMPWWGFLLIGIVIGGAAVIIAILAMKKKK